LRRQRKLFERRIAGGLVDAPFELVLGFEPRTFGGDFSSGIGGNAMTVEDQIAKLRLVVSCFAEMCVTRLIAD
jgi:hypothetical protein